MLALLLVIFDFGRGFLEYVSVSNGARDGARVAAQFDIDCSDSTDRITIRDAALAAAAPLNSPTVVVSPGPSGRCAVTVTHTYNVLIPFVTNGFSLPIVGDVGPLWNGTMSETMVSQ